VAVFGTYEAILVQQLVVRLRSKLRFLSSNGSGRVGTTGRRLDRCDRLVHRARARGLFAGHGAR